MRRLTVVVTLALSLVAAIDLTDDEAAAATTCPTFHVLHDDKIGSVAFAEGSWTISATGVTCAQGASLFTRFLSDWDGVLPGGWSLTANGTSRVFAKTNSTETFSVSPGAVKPSSNTTKNGLCPGTFTVLHNDHIGALRLPKGQYKITTKGLHCWFDVEKLHFFLAGYESGSLPRPWTVNAKKKRILRSPNHWFSLQKSSSAASGGQHPANSLICPATFRVMATTKIDGTTIEAGRYYVNTINGFNCRTASTEFKQFLAAGVTPPQWSYAPDTGTFLDGNAGFQVELVS